MPSTQSAFGSRFCFTLLTSDSYRAAAADAAGVERIGIDRERLGKEARQAGRNTRISSHDWPDLEAIARVAVSAQIFARINPLHESTGCEIETALSCGARVLMLPGVHAPQEVLAFVRMVRGRAIVSILIETALAVLRVREILQCPGIDEVMIGLNDLHLDLGAANHFEVLASPLLDVLAAETHRVGLPLAIGGVGRAGDDTLPVPPDLVYAQYPRLRATGAWIARSFDRPSERVPDYAVELKLIRERLTRWAEASREALERARAELSRRASEWRP